MDQILNIAMAVWFLMMALLCMNKTLQIRAWLLRLYDNVPAAKPWGPFFDWVKKPSFILTVRILGALSMLNFFMLVYAVMYGDSAGGL